MTPQTKDLHGFFIPLLRQILSSNLTACWYDATYPSSKPLGALMERFADIVDAADQLPPDDQLALVDILRKRIALNERKAIVADVHEGRGEYQKRSLKPLSVQAIMNEITNDS